MASKKSKKSVKVKKIGAGYFVQSTVADPESLLQNAVEYKDTLLIGFKEPEQPDKEPTPDPNAELAVVYYNGYFCVLKSKYVLKKTHYFTLQDGEETIMSLPPEILCNDFPKLSQIESL